MLLPVVDDSNTDRPVDACDRPRDELIVDLRALTNQSEAVPLSDQLPQLNWVGCPGIALHFNPDLPQILPMTLVRVKVALRMVKNGQIPLQVGGLEDGLCSKFMVAAQTHHQTFLADHLDAEMPVMNRQRDQRGVDLTAGEFVFKLLHIAMRRKNRARRHHLFVHLTAGVEESLVDERSASESQSLNLSMFNGDQGSDSLIPCIEKSLRDGTKCNTDICQFNAPVSDSSI